MGQTRVYGTALEQVVVEASWYQQVDSGTSGTVTIPPGGTIQLGAWAGGLDALVSAVSPSEPPSFESVEDATGTIVTATLDANGNYSLSAAPASYPVAVIFAYRVSLEDFDPDYSIDSAHTIVFQGASALTVEEADGSPSVSGVDTIVVSNGTLTDDGGGQVTLQTGGGGGTPGGSDGQIQYNDAGSFGGDSRLTWDDTYKSLAVVGADGSELNLYFTAHSDTAYHDAQFWLRKARGTWGARGQVLTNDKLGKLIFSAYHSGGAFRDVAYLLGVATEDQTATNGGGRIEFYTTANGSTSPTKRLYVDQDGTTHALGDVDLNGNSLKNVVQTEDINFAGFAAVAMACDSGATLPTSPSEGQWFLHTPTGRNVLMQYASGQWNPIFAFGAMTVYVDGTNGTDSPDYGGTTGTGAFKTVSYALKQVPPKYSGDVLIKASADTWSSSGDEFVVRGKSPTGNYGITIEGTLPTASASGSCRGISVNITMGAAGSGLNLAYIQTDITTPSTLQYQNYLMVITGGTGAGQKRIIHNHTAGANATFYIIGNWDTLPDATSTISIYNMASMTTFDFSGLSGDEIICEVDGVANVTLRYLNFVDQHGKSAVYLHNQAGVVMDACRAYTSRADRTTEALVQYEGYLLGKVSSCLFLEGGGTNATCLFRLKNSGLVTQDDSIQNSKFDGGASCIILNTHSDNAYSSQGSGLYIANGRTRGIFVAGASQLDIGATVVTSCVQDGILVQDQSQLNLRNSIEISNNGRYGIRGLSACLVNAFGSAGTSMQINNNSSSGGRGDLNTTARLVNTRISYTGNGVNSWVDDGTGVAT